MSSVKTTAQSWFSEGSACVSERAGGLADRVGRQDAKKREAARLMEYINWLCVRRSLSIKSSLNPQSALKVRRSLILHCAVIIT